MYRNGSIPGVFELLCAINVAAINGGLILTGICGIVAFAVGATGFGAVLGGYPG